VYSAGSMPPPSHLTSCTLTKSNLYLDSSFEAAIRDFPYANSLYSTCQISYPYAVALVVYPKSPSPRLIEIFYNDLIFYGEGLLAAHPTFKLEDHHFRLSTVAYSMHLQPPSIAGGSFLHPQPEDAPCRDDNGPT
jgi:hypothetical protein